MMIYIYKYDVIHDDSTHFFYTLSKTVIFNAIITRCRCLYPSFCDPTNLVVHLQIRSVPADGSPEKGDSKSSKIDCPTSKKNLTEMTDKQTHRIRSQISYTFMEIQFSSSTE